MTITAARRILVPVLFAALLLPGCAKYGHWDIDTLRSFYNSPETENTVTLDGKTKKAIDLTAPSVWNDALRYYHKSAFTRSELRGIVRAALITHALHSKDQAQAELSLELLKLSLAEPVFDHTPVPFPTPEYTDSLTFSTGLKRYAAGLAVQCLNDINAKRLQEPELAAKRMDDLRGLLFVLPESESSVPGITGIVWLEIDRDVNSIPLTKVRDLLKGAYPALMP